MQKVIKSIKDCVASKTCCEEKGVNCNQGRKCPVREGTHKPAEAVHQIQDPTVNQQLTSERDAFVNWLHGTYPHSYTITQAADLWFHKHVAALAWKARAAIAATPAAEHATLPAELATQAAQPVLPTGWVPCVVTYEGQHPEEVAYGPQIMMDRLKKWLERYFEMKAAAPVVLPEPTPQWLRDMEWCVIEYDRPGYSQAWCPQCGGCKTDYYGGKAGHKDGCEFRALLATGGQAQAVANDERKSGCAESNRYCHARMCLDGDAEHEHDCPAGRSSIAASKGQQ